jgi:hypothetical protein
MGLFIERLKYEILKLGQIASPELSSTDSLIAEEVSSRGYSYYPNLIDNDTLREIIDTLKIHFSEPNEKFSHRGDTRHYAIERDIPLVKVFSDETRLKNIGMKVMSRPIINLFTLGNYLVAGNRGTSGGGWHRDSMNPQFKAMIYLTDVDESNGPLEIIPGTHKFSTQRRLSRKGLLSFDKQRLKEDEIEPIEKDQGPRETITGRAGTVVIFESSTLHRGRPIELGERLALTNYYYPKNVKRKEVLDNFDID